MEIKYLGHASFLIKSKDTRLVTDPFDPKMVGLKFAKPEADIVTVSHHHPDHDKVALVGGEPLVIDWPGEFEKKGIRIFGHSSFHDKKKGAERGENTLYKIEAEGINVLHCGDLGLIPDDNFIDLIGEVDVLLVPTGGTYTIDPTEAAELVQKIEPAIVVPMHYQQQGMNPKIFADVQPVSEFLRKMGLDSVEPVDKLSLKKEDLTAEEMKVVVMKTTT